MPRTSMRTLVLMLELFAAVVALQYVVAVRPARAGAVWLAGDYVKSLPASDAPTGTVDI